MNILVISNTGEFLPVVYRIRKQSPKVGIWIYLHNPKCSELLYRGILNNRIGVKELKKVLSKVDLVIFDTIRKNEKKKQDGALLKLFGLKANVEDVFGAVADKLKKDYKVIGGSSATGEVELDRLKGEQLAKKAGLNIPENYQFKTLSEGIKFLKGRKDLWVFKPFGNLDLDLTYVEKFPGDLIGKMEYEIKERIGEKVEYILQKKITGVEISTEMIFDGEKAVSFNHTIEDKKFLAGNLGVNIGSQNNIVWIKKNENGLLVKELKNIIPFLKEANYMGMFDINCIVNQEDKKPYYLEATCRCGYDALYCLLSLLQTPIADFFVNNFQGNFYDGFAASERITIPPFPYSDEGLLEELAKDTLIYGEMDDYPNFWMEDVYINKKGKLACAGSDGILGVVTAKGKTIDEAANKVYQNIKRLRISNDIQYRNDLGKRALKAMNLFKEWGIKVE